MENLQALFRCVNIISCVVCSFLTPFFNKAVHFFVAAPAEETIEETIADVLDLIDVQGEVFEVYDSDSEDEELEFVDSFV